MPSVITSSLLNFFKSKTWAHTTDPEGDKYGALVRAADDGIFIVDFETGCLLEANPGGCRLFGYTADAFQEMKGRDLHPQSYSEDVDTMSASINTEASAKNLTMMFQRADHSTFWGDLRISNYVENNVKLYVATIRDVTERVEQQRALEDSMKALKETQAKLIQASKLAAMGELGAGIAHELNQPITAIQGFAQRMRRKPELSTASHLDELDIIISEARRMARIVDNVRTFARDTDFNAQATDAVRPVYDALMLINQDLRKREIEIQLEISDELSLVLADATKLQQVFLNLLTNARDAMSGDAHGGPRVIRISVQPQNDKVLYRIEDSGPGIPKDVQSKIFDPFFTTKPPGKGTGLGLSLSYGIIKDHKGEMTCGDSDALGGAKFDVTISALGHTFGR